MKINKQRLDIKWLDFSIAKAQINAFRHSVYVEEQGLHQDKIEVSGDEAGLHLAAFYEGELVSIISAFFIDKNADEYQLFSNDLTHGNVMRFGMRMEKKIIRGSGLSELLCIHMGLSSFETIRPQCTFVHLFEQHQRLAQTYMDWGFRPDSAIDDKSILICRGSNEQRAQYRLNRQKLELVSGLFTQVSMPSLSAFLIDSGRTDIIAVEALKHENLYISGLTLAEDLSRLKHQAQLLFNTQTTIFDQLEGITPAGRLLDMGAGAGVYLSKLQTHPRFINYQIEGLDNAQTLCQYAKEHYPEIKWHQASVYDSGLPAGYYDFIHAGFLFIHLSNAELALKEIHRLLSSNGLLYIVDVNDATFKGPKLIGDIIKKHQQLYEGNRNIMSQLPNLAKQCGFTAHYSTTNLVFNSGSQQHPTPNNADVILENNTFISLFDFIGLREGLTQDYQTAKQDCLASQALMSIEIQTQVYRPYSL